MNSSYTILCVDDDPDDLMLISEAFEQVEANIQLVKASHGLEALQKLTVMAESNSLPCLVILDINMPVMDGKETLKKIKERPDLQKVPVIIFSTSTDESDKRTALSLGADFITKPLSYGDMRSLAHQFLSKCKIEFNKAAASST